MARASTLPPSLQDFLQAEGFKRWKSGIYWRPLVSGLNAWTSFATAGRGTSIQPRVGIVATEVNEYLKAAPAELDISTKELGDKHPYTVGVELGRLFGRSTFWTFPPFRDDTIEDLVEGLRVHGGDYYRKFHGLSDVAAALRRKEMASGWGFWTTPLVFAMQRDAEGFEWILSEFRTYEVQLPNNHDRFISHIRKMFFL